MKIWTPNPENHPLVGSFDSKGMALLDPVKLDAATSANAHLLGTQKGRFQSGPKDSSITTAPGISSGDDRYPWFMTQMRKDLLKSVPKPKVVDGSLVEPGFLTDLSLLRTQPGYGMDPYPAPFLDTTTRQSVQTWKSPRDRQLAEILAGEVFQWEPGGTLRLSKPSTMGMPHWTRDMSLKQERIQHALTHIESIAKHIVDGDLEALAIKHQVLLAYHSSYRHQADGWKEDSSGPKDREAPNFRFLTEGGAIPIAGRTISGSPLARTRVRFVYALSSSIAHLLAAIATGYRNRYLTEYAFTWKHKGPEDIARKVRGHLLVATDVSQWDTRFPDFWASLIFDTIAKESPRAAQMMAMAYSAPIAVKAGSQRDEDRMFFTGSPTDPSSFNLKYGLPSGHPLSPDMSKAMGPLDPIRAMDKLGLIDQTDPVQVRDFLKGKHPEVIHLNMGDDQLTGVRPNCPQCPSRDALKEALLDDAYMVGGIEEPTGFLGNTIIDMGGLEYKAVPVLDSYIARFWTPEASISTPRRPYPAVGFFARADHYSVLGEPFEIARRVVHETVRSKYRYDLEGEFRKMYDIEIVRMRMEGVDMSGIPSHLKEKILQRPDRLIWDENLIAALTPEQRLQVSELITHTIPPEDIDPHVGKLFKGKFNA